MKYRPILFNNDMVKAILQGRKTQTRRIIKPKYSNTAFEMHTDKYGTRLIEIEEDIEGVTYGKREDGTSWRKIRAYIEPKPPFKPGNVLWVRETWNVNNLRENESTGEYEAGFIYKANDEPDNGFQWVSVSADAYDRYMDSISVYFDGWRPSIHMPKEAARLFLLVKSVRAERLKDIKPEDGMEEGFTGWNDFVRVWNSTVKKPDLPAYGWDANPWVWVIEFERIKKPEGWPCTERKEST